LRLGEKQEKMKKGNKSDLCPLCGGKKRPVMTISRPNGRAGVAVKNAMTVPDSFWAESVNDKTANGFAEVLLNPRKLRPEM
jgi:hypothetical protein